MHRVVFLDFDSTGRRRAEAELTWDAVASRYRCAYQRTLEAHRS